MGFNYDKIHFIACITLVTLIYTSQIISTVSNKSSYGVSLRMFLFSLSANFFIFTNNYLKSLNFELQILPVYTAVIILITIFVNQHYYHASFFHKKDVMAFTIILVFSNVCSLVVLVINDERYKLLLSDILVWLSVFYFVFGKLTQINLLLKCRYSKNLNLFFIIYFLFFDVLLLVYIILLYPKTDLTFVNYFILNSQYFIGLSISSTLDCVLLYLKLKFNDNSLSEVSILVFP